MILQRERIPDFVRAETLAGALACLARGRFEVLCGGTDFYPANVERTIDEDILDISGLKALRVIEPLADGWRIGAAASWSEIQKARLPRWFDALQMAARTIGGPQIQNTGSVGGNVCNASPAADGIVALLALDARVLLESSTRRRELPLTEFLQGNRQTLRRADELVTGFDIPGRSVRARSNFTKLGHRRYLVISVAMVACLIDLDAQDRISWASVAVGSCSLTAQRLAGLEARLIGQKVTDPIGECVEEGDWASLTPRDDIRGSAAYRQGAVATLLRRSLQALQS